MKKPVRALLEMIGLLPKKEVVIDKAGLPKDKWGFYITPSVTVSTKPLLYKPSEYVTYNVGTSNWVTGIAYPGYFGSTQIYHSA